MEINYRAAGAKKLKKMLTGQQIHFLIRKHYQTQEALTALNDINDLCVRREQRFVRRGQRVQRLPDDGDRTG